MIYNFLKTAFVAVFLITASFSQISAKNIASTDATPDFAYPKTVAKDSKALLESALKKNQPSEVLRALMDLTLAENMLDHETTVSLLPEIDSIASSLPHPYSAIGYIIEAEIYSDIYSSNSYVYNQRILPEDSGSDPLLWNKDQFQSKVDSLLIAALLQKETAEITPLQSIQTLISPIENISDLTVFDFIVYKVVNLRSTFSRNLTIPFYKDNSDSFPTVIDLINSLLDLHSTPSHARNTAILRKTALLPKNSGADFLWQQIVEVQNSEFCVPLMSVFYFQYLEREPSDSLTDPYQTTGFKDFYNLFQVVRERYRDSEYFEMLQSIEKNIFAQSVSLSFPSLIESRKPFRINIDNNNFNSFYLLLLDAGKIKTDRNISLKQAKQLPLLASHHCENKSAAPFVLKDSVEFSVDGPGRYLIVVSDSPEVNGIITNAPNPSFNFFTASDIDLITISPSFESVSSAEGCYVVNSSDSSPIEGASVEFRPYSRPNQTNVIISKTDSSGFAHTSIKSGDIIAHFNKSIASSHIYADNQKDRTRYNIRLYPSQALYRPGDSISFLGIAYCNDNIKGELLTGKNIKVYLRDANYQTVDSLSAVTDASGRIFGTLGIPKTGLLGRWTIEGKFIEKVNDGFYPSSVNIEVAEYKTPTFLVSIAKESATQDSISFCGTALTYSGMPVADSEVRYTVSYQPDYFFRVYNAQNPQSYSASSKTDSNGNFLIRLPLGNLNPKEYRGVFRISATVTDRAGETQTSPAVPFWLTESYTLRASVPSLIDASSKEINLDVKVCDPSGMPVIKKVDFTILSSGNKIIQSECFESPVCKIDVSTLPSGSYIFRFRLSETEEDWQDYPTVLYRLTDTLPPVESVLWAPQSQIIVQNDDKDVKILYGSSFKDQHILCTISGSNGNYENLWLIASGKNEYISIPLPAPDERIYVNFYTLRDHKYYSQEVTVIPAIQNQKLKIITESFRKSLSSGEHEKWSFRLQYDGKPVKGYAYALLYDKALDALAHLNWSTSLFTPFYPRMLSLYSQSSYPYYENFRKDHYYPVRLPKSPVFEFQTYGYPFYSAYYTRGHVVRHYASNARMKTSMSIKESNLESAVEMPAMATMDTAEAEDVAVLGASSLSEAGGIEEESSSSSQTEEIRPIEMPVAFFKPNLNSDNDGNISIDFTVPNFNTTWNLILGAYSPSLLSSQIILETVASKSVMVKMNSPRFMRTGDRIELSATMYNNSSSPREITGVYEIFNPLTDEVIQRYQSEAVLVAPSGNDIFATEFFCPSSISIVGLRVYAISDNATDGEATVIPVLPSSQPVITSSPFYIKAAERGFETDIPSLPEDSKVTFTYCDNPIWEVLTALPPIVNSDKTSVSGLISALYANSVGSGIIDKYPNLRKGLEMITAGEAGDSLLVSNLQKNKDLKIVSLNNTPWVNNASDENLRLSRLSSLLDSESSRREIEDMWNKILALHNPDGGWSWCAGMKSSRWTTENVLLNLGQLKRNGYITSLPKLNSSVRSGLQYCEKEIVEDYNKYGKNSEDFYLRGLWAYLYIRSFYPEIAKSSSFSRLATKSLDIIAKDWSKTDIYEKATIAIVLWRNGNQKTALKILESLREFSVSENGAVYYANVSFSYSGQSALAVTARVLEAFSEIRPSDSIIDGLRQWMILQKQVQNWGERASSVYAINALLTSGSDWAGDYSAPIINIDGRNINISEIDRLTGSCRIDLKPTEARGKISISRESPTQAWGGIIGQYIAQMNEIKAEEVPDLSIKKDYLKLIEKGGVLTAVADTVFSVGDRVRVSLTIDCSKYLEYVAVNDERASCLEPADQLSGYTVIDGIWCYRETRDNATNLFIEFLPRGKHVITYDCYVVESGKFASGISTAQSQYAPMITAHSSGTLLTVDMGLIP